MLLTYRMERSADRFDVLILSTSGAILKDMSRESRKIRKPRHDDGAHTDIDPSMDVDTRYVNVSHYSHISNS